MRAACTEGQSRSGVRITGLRLRGPDPEIRGDAYEYDNSRGIEALDASDLTVDNNELSGWSHGAVYLATPSKRGSRTTTCTTTGVPVWATGWCCTTAPARSSSATRSPRTGTRSPATGSAPSGTTPGTTWWSTTPARTVSTCGQNETQDNGSPFAGDVIHIKNNSFRSSAQPAVAGRGQPYTGAWISGNCFAHGGSSSAVLQRHYFGNLHVGANTYGTTTGTCHQSGGRETVGWQLSDAGTGNWQDLLPYTFDVSEVGFGDFDGDGRTDVFRTAGGKWYYSSGGRSSWVPLASSGCPLAGLELADLTGDGRADVFTGRCGG